ncbi:tRNA N(3)-methylcytidine methyltransferase METTL6-like isoform X1 [Gordionus sp. m RMFG-2023]|uniref:tRNA N(3)-methylcytidine methyltransferase METTL6-like isoform X1 n=2 Tax=Gordionus sp. m RMFG-2023 TaxID=3053472 RepID=UPI0031FDC8E4
MARIAENYNTFKIKKIRNGSQKSWEKFYTRNKDKFFKDRNWFEKEFYELDLSNEQVTLLEVGCGVGNLIIPLLQRHKNLYIIGCDFSKSALLILKDNLAKKNLSHRTIIYDADITKDNLQNYQIFDTRKADYITLIFALSAIDPISHLHVLQNFYQVLKNGGKILFRDYAVSDHAMLRFKKLNQINANFYYRQDGTLSYFFSIDYLRQIFESVGFITEECQYIKKEINNIKENIKNIPRQFIQAKFMKPI